MLTATWKLEKDLCRCCHSEGSFTSLAEPSHDLAQPEIISALLQSCFNIDIRRLEGTYNASTYTICEPCILRLRDASIFKKQVLQCEERFRDMYKNDEALVDVKSEQEEEDTIKYEFKEEYFEVSEDGVSTADDGHDDATLLKQPRRETKYDKTDEVEPQKAMKLLKEITSNVDINKKTSTDIKSREVNGTGPTNKTDNSVKLNQTRVILQNVFICDGCGERFDDKCTLTTHLRIHTDEKPYSCSFCEYKYATKSELNTHLRVHTGEKPYSCSFCAYKCARKRNLTCHLRIHTGEKPYSCSFCDYKCAEKSRVKRHSRIHTGEKPYSCSFCEYKCSQKTALTSHSRIHTGEKPYSCSFCEQKFTTLQHLTCHLRIHTNEKPYSCSFCGHKFSKKFNLTMHLRIHTGEKPYSCSLCEYKCTQKITLQHHLRNHTGGKPYSCSICEYKCARKQGLTRHLRIHTGKNKDDCQNGTDHTSDTPYKPR